MMDLKFVNVKWCLKLFIILKLFIHESKSDGPPENTEPQFLGPNMTLTDLRTVCCIDRGTKEITDIKDVVQYCTSLARRGNNDQTTRNDLIILNKYQLPVVFVFNNKGHHTMKDLIKNERHRNKFLEKIASLIVNEKIDALAFDHFAPESIWSRKNHNKVQKHIVEFFTDLKARFPNKLFGLCLPKKRDDLKDAFNVEMVDAVVDFYLIKSIEYQECKKNLPIIRTTHQEDMRTVDPTNLLETTINMIMTHGYNLKKCLLEIRIIVNKVNWYYAAHKNDMSYASYCSHDPKHKMTKFCYDTLSQFYAKGLLVKKYSLAGAFLSSIDRDDYNCACTCGEYPVTQCIWAGMKGLGAPFVTECLYWAHLPRDRVKIDETKPVTDDTGMDEDNGPDEDEKGPPPDLKPQALQPGGDPDDES